MKTKGTFIKSQEIDHEIVAMKVEMMQLKGKLALSKDVKQASTEKKGEGTKSSTKRGTKDGRRCLPRQANH
jgi:hypothetical protein